MLLVTLVLASLPLSVGPNSAPQSAAQAAQEKSVRERFVELHAAMDEAGCRKLWASHRHEVLYTIDEDLEGALATWEKSPTQPDKAAIAAKQERALWGARLASAELGHPIFLDYTSAFVSQSDAQKAQFRAGQRTHSESRAALKAGDVKTAVAKAQECIANAAPLGDWWGHAMGLSALGAAHAQGKAPAEAIAPLGEAALIYRDLLLVGDEYSALRKLATCLVETAAKERAKVVIARALELAKLLGDTKGEAELAALTKSL
jgi:hypothetical protein